MSKITIREEIEIIQHIMPEHTYFHYTPDRESLWLLSHLMQDGLSVAALRQTPYGKLLDRPSLKSVVAKSGGVMRRGQVCAELAQSVYQYGWRDYDLSFDEWAVGRRSGWQQVSRGGGNLVLQVGFTAAHAQLFHKYLGRPDRKLLEYSGHPVRLSGAPTMAWVRLDVCMETGVALIEEVQSDWFRFVGRRRTYLCYAAPRSRALKNLQSYEDELLASYGKDWSKGALLAALVVLREELGVKDVFMHQAWSGPTFKTIHGTPPPSSLYTKLPKAFCFTPTDAPFQNSWFGRVRKPCGDCVARRNRCFGGCSLCDARKCGWAVLPLARRTH